MPKVNITKKQIHDRLLVMSKAATIMGSDGLAKDLAELAAEIEQDI